MLLDRGGQVQYRLNLVSYINNMKILLYGFKLFGKYKTNISERVVNNIQPRQGLVKVVFPVKFNKSLFTRTVKQVRPDVILGIGQCGRGNKIRIERTAHNQGQHVRHVSLQLRPDAVSRISYDAGDYVCNFSMVTILDALRRTSTKFAFIHVPQAFNLDKAVQFVERQLKAIKK